MTWRSTRSPARILLTAGLLGLLASACDSAPAGPGPDGASDGPGSGDDSGSDGGRDAGRDDAGPGDDSIGPGSDQPADTGSDGQAPPDSVIADSPLPDAGPPAEPITAPANQWTWVDFADSTCDDGSPTGIGVNLNGSSNLLIFLNGGGACWDFLTCYQLNTATHGPFGAPQFAGTVAAFTGNILDRNDTQNPFRDWNLVFVPYCTGDVHSGDNDADYNGQTFRHRGRANLRAFLARLAATVTPDKLAFSGSSAGGFGAGMNYDLARQYFPGGQGYLIDDAGPPLIGTEISADLRDAWYASWRLDLALDPICPACRDDFSAFLPVVANLHSADRLALLSSKQDQVIRTYFQKTAQDFEAALDDLATQVIDPLDNGRYFFVPGESHTMLGTPASYTSPGGVPLYTWLGEMVTDDAAWASQPAP